MNFSRLALIGMILASGSLMARSNAEQAFLKAVQEGDLETFEHLFECVCTTRTFDKALHAAARNGDCDMYYKIAPRASNKGRRVAKRSLQRHKRPCCCQHRLLTDF